MPLLPRCAIALALSSALAGCATSPTAGSPARLALYEGRPLDGMHVTAADPDTEQVLAASSTTVAKGSKNPNSLVSVTKSARSAADDDALTLRWKDVWRGALRIEGAPLDLTPYMAKGTLAFDLNVQDLAKGGISITVGCGNNCERSVPYVAPGRAAQGKGWQHVVLPLSCFVREGDSFQSVTRPFTLDGGGNGDVSVANIVIDPAGTPNTSCADYKTASVTPAPLAEWWSIDWWMPRHQQKLDEVKALKAAGKSPELIFIGDSITQGWEKEGTKVWERNYKQYNALDLGFGGDRTENVLWRLQHGEIDGLAPKLAVLMFGTNNTGHRQDSPATTAAAIARNIAEVQRRLPNTRILLLAVFPRDATPAGAMRQINEKINAILPSLADNKKVFFLNINQVFLQADGTLPVDIMPDLLHPNEKGYELWANAMRPELERLIKEH